MSRLTEMPVDEVVACLLEDMEMLRDGSWIPDNDSIAAHCELISELHRRLDQ
jgi:hypothetical protein